MSVDGITSCYTLFLAEGWCEKNAIYVQSGDNLKGEKGQPKQP